MKIKELKKLPRREWNEKKSYDSIYVIPSGKKHDSGFALMYIIGLKDGEPKEIAAACDDILWEIPNPTEHDFRTDMYYRPNIIHFWSRRYNFQVGCSLSSTTIKLVEKNAEE